MSKFAEGKADGAINKELESQTKADNDAYKERRLLNAIAHESNKKSQQRLHQRELQSQIKTMCMGGHR